MLSSDNGRYTNVKIISIFTSFFVCKCDLKCKITLRFTLSNIIYNARLHRYSHHFGVLSGNGLYADVTIKWKIISMRLPPVVYYSHSTDTVIRARDKEQMYGLMIL